MQVIEGHILQVHNSVKYVKVTLLLSQNTITQHTRDVIFFKADMENMFKRITQFTLIEQDKQLDENVRKAIKKKNAPLFFKGNWAKISAIHNNNNNNDLIGKVISIHTPRDQHQLATWKYEYEQWTNTVKDVEHHILQDYVDEVYERSRLFHLLKDDVTKMGYERKIPDTDILKVIKFAQKYAEFQANPFQVYKHSNANARMAFEALDLFAAMYNVPRQKRIVANVTHTLSNIMNNEGHTCQRIDIVVAHTYKSLVLRMPDVNQNEIEHVIREFTPNEFIIYLKNTKNTNPSQWLYIASVYKKERYIATRIADIIEQTIDTDFSQHANDIQTYIEDFQLAYNITLHHKQRNAIIALFQHDTELHVLTGLPGTGKSSVVKCVRYIANIINLQTIVCAPTGKAANRLGNGASTIHRALEVTYDKQIDKFVFARNQDKPLQQDILIVDESSMLDLDITYHLFKAIPKQNMRILLLGDTNQLPSVNYGNVLHDIVNSQIVPTTHLTKIYRQNNGSHISKLSKAVIDQKLHPDKRDITYYTTSPEIEYIQEHDPKKIHRTILQIYLKHTSSSQSSQSSQEPIILIPTKKGDVGTNAINSTLHRYYYKQDAQEKILSFRPNEKIICIANTYFKDPDGNVIDDKSVFNGESGVFQQYKTKDTVLIDIPQDDKYNILVEKNAIDMGYAITVHKSQGSEYDIVILVLHSSHSIMLNQEVFYTAITRAKQKLYIIGTSATIYKAVSNKNMQRHSSISDMLHESFEISM